MQDTDRTDRQLVEMACRVASHVYRQPNDPQATKRLAAIAEEYERRTGRTPIADVPHGFWWWLQLGVAEEHKAAVLAAVSEAPAPLPPDPPKVDATPALAAYRFEILRQRALDEVKMVDHERQLHQSEMLHILLDKRLGIATHYGLTTPRYDLPPVTFFLVPRQDTELGLITVNSDPNHWCIGVMDATKNPIGGPGNGVYYRTDNLVELGQALVALGLA
jgi:hypothetical protein